MVADGSGGTKTHGGTNLPNGGGIAVLLHKLVYIIQYTVCFVTGSGHGKLLLPIHSVCIIAQMNEKGKRFFENRDIFLDAA